MIKQHFHKLIENTNSINENSFNDLIEKGKKSLFRTENLTEENFVNYRKIEKCMNSKHGKLIELKIIENENILGYLIGFISNDLTFMVVFSH